MFKKKIKLELRQDVSETLFGYYYTAKYKGKTWSIVNFAWIKDDNHEEYYVNGVWSSWEAMDDDYNIIRAKTFKKLFIEMD